uniref:HORMA domain-containing protein n=1 Tax=Plectus sambesii TaxID=2011161 RepID=A0A914XQR1_9BILA
MNRIKFDNYEHLAKEDRPSLNSCVADMLAEFLQIFTHAVLHVRDVYPNNAFTTQKYLDIPVQLCSHPGVSKYVTSAVSSIRRWCKSDGLLKFGIFLVDAFDNVHERFVFTIYAIDRGSIDQQTKELESSIAKLEKSFRDCILSTQQFAPSNNDNCDISFYRFRIGVQLLPHISTEPVAVEEFSWKGRAIDDKLDQTAPFSESIDTDLIQMRVSFDQYSLNTLVPGDD